MGPEGTGDIIREVRNNFFMMESGFNDSDVYLNTQVTTLNPSGVSADSDYGFLTTTQDSDGNTVVDGGPSVWVDTTTNTRIRIRINNIFVRNK